MYCFSPDSIPKTTILAASPLSYKLSLTIHKAIHHNSPDYLASLLHLQIPITTLQTRSSNTFILTTPHLYKLHSSNIRSFALSAPYHWNSLPKHLRITHQLPPLNATSYNIGGYRRYWYY